MRRVNVVFLAIVTTFILVVATAPTGFVTEPPHLPLKAPVVVTTCGQSPGALMVRIAATKAGIECTQNDTLKAEDLKGKPYKTLIVTMGTSLKGMGAAGTDIQAEVKRIKTLIEEAKKQGMPVIGAHIEGMSRRVDETDAQSIETVAPVSDIIIVKADGNQDGLFTRIANERNIPLYSIEKTLDLVQTFKEFFKK